MTANERDVVYHFLVTGAEKAIADFARVHRAAQAIDDDEITRIRATDAARARTIDTQTKLGGVILGSAAAEKRYGTAVDSSARAIAARNAYQVRENELQARHTQLLARNTELETALEAAITRTTRARAKTIEQVRADNARISGQDTRRQARATGAQQLLTQQALDAERVAKAQLSTALAEQQAAAKELDQADAFGEAKKQRAAKTRAERAKSRVAVAQAELAEVQQRALGEQQLITMQALDAERVAKAQLSTALAEQQAAARELDQADASGEAKKQRAARTRADRARARVAVAQAELAQFRLENARADRFRLELKRAEAESSRTEFDSDEFERQLRISLGALGRARTLKAQVAENDVLVTVRRANDAVLQLQEEAYEEEREVNEKHQSLILNQLKRHFAQRNALAIKDAENRETTRVSDDEGKILRLTQMLADGPIALGRWQTRIAAIISGVVLLIPLIGVATGLMGALLSVSLVALGGIGIFAAAAVGHLTAVTKALKEAHDTGQPLEGRFIAVGRAFDQMADRWREFLAATQGPVFVVFIAALNLVASLLPRLTPIANTVARALQGVFAQLDAATATDTFADFLEMLDTFAPRVINGLARSILSIGEGITELALAFAPFIDFFITGLEDMTAAFANWANNLSGTEGFQDFMDWVQRNGPIVRDSLLDIGQAIIDLAVALQPIASLGLEILRFLAQLISALPTPALTAFILVVLGTVIALRTLRAVVHGGRLFAGLIDTLPFLSARLAVATAGMTALEAQAVRTRMAMNLMVAGFGILAAVLAVVTLGLTIWWDIQDRAASTTDRQVEAAQNFARGLRDGASAADMARAKVEELDSAMIKSQWWQRFGNPVRPFPVTALPELAAEAGISNEDYAGGLIGDAAALARANQGWDALIAKRKKDLDDASWVDKAWGPQRQLLSQAYEGKRVYNEEKFSKEQLALANEKLGKSSLGVVEGLIGEKNAFGAVADEINRMLTSKSDAETRADAAVAAYEAWLDAVEATQDAEESLDDTRRDVARANEDALARVGDAERAYTDAQHDACDAQNALNEARRTAAERIQDLQIKLRDLKNDQEGADISVERAKETYQRVFRDPNASALDRREAALGLSRAYYSQQDTTREGKQTKKDAAAAEKLGIEKSPEVQAALRRKRDADIAEGRALQDKTRATEDYNETLSDGVESILDAEDALKKATKAEQDALVQHHLTAAAIGKTAFQMERFAAARDQADKDLLISLDMVDKNNVEERLRRIRNYLIDAMAIAAGGLAGPPSSTLDQYRNPSSGAGGGGTTIIGGGLQKIAVPITKSSGGAPGGGGGGSISGVQKGGATKTPTYQPKGYVEKKKTIADYRGYSYGGQVGGTGTSEADDIPAWLSTGEHVWTAREVTAAGGHGLVERLREGLRSGRLGRAELAAFLATAMRFSRGGSVTPMAVDVDSMDLPGRFMATLGLGFAGGGPVKRGPAAQFDPAQFYAALDVAARGVSVPAQVPRSSMAGIASTVTSSVTQGGVSMGDVTINNPVQERSDTTLRRRLQRLAYVGQR